MSVRTFKVSASYDWTLALDTGHLSNWLYLRTETSYGDKTLLIALIINFQSIKNYIGLSHIYFCDQKQSWL